jgi:hypothetical protein
LFAGLIVRAGLRPCEGRRQQGVAPTDLLFVRTRLYCTDLDLLANLFGYAPLGFLIVLAMLHSGWASRA